MQKPAKQRLVEHTTMNGAGCLIWDGPIGTGGYGSMIFRCDGVKKYLRAHRVAYEAYRGPIPDGQIVMHTCDIPACVNPNHLRLGTHADNMADKVAKGRHRNPARDSNGATKLNQAAVVVVLDSKLSVQTLAAAFGVTICTINRIRREARRAKRI